MNKFISVCMAMMFVLLLSDTVRAETIRCASTTSTQNSGLFEYLLPIFEKETGIKVQVVAVGTGAALELGKRGDVDVVLVHAREDELAMAAAGWFVGRRDIMYNDFVIAGPMADPAAVRESGTAVEAFGRIMAKGFSFVSRGDNSGTHMKEMKIWDLLGDRPDPKIDRWYLSVGQGMAKSIRVAAEKQAYILTDRGTWLAMKDIDRSSFIVNFAGDPVLFNQYGVMAVNPARHPQVKYNESLNFIDWLASENGQRAIGSFSDAAGNRLFIPNAE